MLSISMMFIIALGMLSTKSSPEYCITREVPEAFETARAVFVGTVIKIAEPNLKGESAADSFYVVTFRVEKSWKGTQFISSFEVLSDQGRHVLGYPEVKEGERYLVYADPFFGDETKTATHSIVSSCSRTAKLPSERQKFDSVLNSLEFNRENGSADLRKLDAIFALPLKRRA